MSDPKFVHLFMIVELSKVQTVFYYIDLPLDYHDLQAT